MNKLCGASVEETDYVRLFALGKRPLKTYSCLKRMFAINGGVVIENNAYVRVRDNYYVRVDDPIVDGTARCYSLIEDRMVVIYSAYAIITERKTYLLPPPEIV